MDNNNKQYDTVIILDFGSQYTQLIARKIRELRIYSKIVPFSISVKEIRKINPAGIILSGGPASVYGENAPHCDPEVFKLGIPVLGICYGLQLMIYTLGGKVSAGKAREYGKTELTIIRKNKLFDFPEDKIQVWMSHGDKVIRLPERFTILARTENTDYAAIVSDDGKNYGIQFHPEVVHTPKGMDILKNFCTKVCRCKCNWTMSSFIETAMKEIKEKVDNGNVILGLSGGVDSSVAAALIHKAIGNRLTCIFVNNGLMRKNEPQKVKETFAEHFKIPFVYVDAEDRFLEKLRNISEPEEKRKIIGYEFVQVFNEAASKIPDVNFLAQGTTYPDVIESVSIGGNPSSKIKSHHNVGGLPEIMKLKLLEPLRQLFKDEVREVGRQLGLPEEIIMRQPFPGPGLAVRFIGAINKKDLNILREADSIVIDEMKKSHWYYKTWQTFAVFLPIKTVGVMGDERTYENVIALRAVESSDGMTADWVKIPYHLLERVSSRIINEVKGVNRVVYDLTSKPPGTIEWE